MLAAIGDAFSWLGLGECSASGEGTRFGEGKAPIRPRSLKQLIVFSRLSRAVALLSAEEGCEEERAAGLAVLRACEEMITSEEFFRRVNTHRGPIGQRYEGTPRMLPPELCGETIATLEVNFDDECAMSGQRRYANPFVCVAGLSKRLRRAATHGLCVEGDIEACELICFQHACASCGLECPLLNRHLALREEQLDELARLVPFLSSSSDKRRGFAKSVVNASLHLAAPTPGVSELNEPNALQLLLTEFRVPAGCALPPWLAPLSAEFRRLAPRLVSHEKHSKVMAELWATSPEKADRISSALHFVLTPYETAAMDAALIYARQFGLVLNDEEWDGCLWLGHSFQNDMQPTLGQHRFLTPAGHDPMQLGWIRLPEKMWRARIFQAMSAFIRTELGMHHVVIREKDIPMSSLLLDECTIAAATNAKPSADNSPTSGLTAALFSHALLSSPLLSEWALLSPTDMMHLRATCTAMQSQSTADFLTQLLQHGRHLQCHPRHGSELCPRALFELARRTHAQLRFISQLPAAVKAAGGDPDECVVAGSFPMHRLLQKEACADRAPADVDWEPGDLDLFLQSRRAFQAALDLATTSYKADLGCANAYFYARGEYNEANPAPTHDLAQFDFRDPRQDPHAPSVTVQMLHAMLVNEANGLPFQWSTGTHGLTGVQVAARLHALLPENLGRTAADEKSYRIRRSHELVIRPARRVLGSLDRPQRINLILISARHGGLIDDDYQGGWRAWLHRAAPPLPALSTRQIIDSFDMRHVAVAMTVDASMREHFECADDALDCVRRREIRFSRQMIDQVPSALTVMKRVDKYLCRGFRLGESAW